MFWTGTSRAIAWGQVATHASVTELVVENLHPESPPRYELNGNWLATESRVETIRVSGAPDDLVEILSTRNGPLLGALLPGDPNARSLALRWAGSSPRSGIEALLSVQHSSSWTGFRASLERYPGPVATFLYADARQIGKQVAGNLPIRSVQTTLLPVIGGSRYYDWRGFIPFSQLPSVHGSTRPLARCLHPSRRARVPPTGELAVEQPRGRRSPADASRRGATVRASRRARAAARAGVGARTAHRPRAPRRCRAEVGQRRHAADDPARLGRSNGYGLARSTRVPRLSSRAGPRAARRASGCGLGGGDPGRL